MSTWTLASNDAGTAAGCWPSPFLCRPRPLILCSSKSSPYRSMFSSAILELPFSQLSLFSFPFFKLPISPYSTTSVVRSSSFAAPLFHCVVCRIHPSVTMPSYTINNNIAAGMPAFFSKPAAGSPRCCHWAPSQGSGSSWNLSASDKSRPRQSLHDTTLCSKHAY
ncbi:hypothetical protein J3458_004274 [Metarhizium acridum]|uniref:uncharacterized protein n=1 Tax=Metarhizium acridum TaxID=92637 RepID=UPI001C6ABDE1|nr:hypothetical protein J3458_004274 [Metarhizium acridum]